MAPLTRGLRALRGRQAADREIADEVSHYLDETTAHLIRGGLSPTDARRAARIELGGETAVREHVRSYGWENMIENLFADLRYAARRLAANPGFAAVSILTLALGIGARPPSFRWWTPSSCAPFPTPLRSNLCACGSRRPTAIA